MEIEYVTHSMPAFHIHDYLTPTLKSGVITSRHGRWKIGLSINGCYRCFDKHGYGYASFIFDFETIRDKVVPTLYFPLKRYTWYEFKDFMVTWYNLAWEAELCVLRGTYIPVSDAKAIVLKTRRRKLLELIRECGLQHLTKLPYSPMHEWARRQLNMRGKREERIILADQYNKWVTEWFNLDYTAIKSKLPDLIESKETERVGQVCRICRHYYWDFIIGEGLSISRCLLSGEKRFADDSCKRFEFNVEDFLDKSHSSFG